MFGLITAQGVRKASFNAFKLLHRLGPVRLQSGGGGSRDGVDAMATMSPAGDAIQILVYDQRSARCVDQECGGLHEGERGCVDHALRLRKQG